MEQQDEPKESGAAPSSSPGARGWLAAGLAFGVVLVLFVWLASRSGKKAGHGEAWSGTVREVAGAAPGGKGLECCSPDRAVCSPLARGGAVPAGSMLRTDARTRAVLELRDGTRLTLGGDSELSLDGHLSSQARLEHGELALDVPRQGSRRTRIVLPLGVAELESAKVSLLADPDHVEAEVVRGSLRLFDRAERAVTVHAGEGASVEADRPPEVYPTSRLGGALRASERAFAPRATDDGGLAGLGELSARKPGEERERAGAVRLASHSTKVRIVEGFARTEIDETFTNETDDVLEGIYRFPLPPGAQIERLALDRDGSLEEGAFVDRDRASAIWRGAIVNAGGKRKPEEEIVWVPGPWRDPALLEWQRGGRFELHVYPIPRHGSRRVVLAYTEVVAPEGDRRRYVYPLPYDPSGSTRIGRFEMDVEVRGHVEHAGVRSRGYTMRQERLPDGGQSLIFTAEQFAPAGDLSLEYSVPGREATAWAYQPSPDEVALERAALDVAHTAAPASPLTAAVGRSSEATGAPYVAISLRPRLPRSSERAERAFALVVDSSRSMFGERYRRATELAMRIAAELDRDDPVTALACDSTCRELPSGPIAAGPEASRAIGEFLRSITPEGGSDVTAAIRHGREALRSVQRGAARVVYLGDGTPTIGAVSPALVRREIEASVPREVGTVSAVAIGSDADTDTLATLAEAGGGIVVPYAPGEPTVDAAYAVLGATYGAALSDPSVELPDGLVDVAPARLATVAPGGETMILARMVRPVVEGSITLRGKVGDAPFERRYPLRIEPTTAKGNAFVPRLWAAAKIAGLEKETELESRRRAVELSSRFHVASRYTSLLVLESAAMFRAFGIARQDRTPLWSGDSDASSTSAEAEAALADPDDRGGPAGEAPQPLDDASGGSGLGTTGMMDKSAAKSSAASPPAPAPARKRAAMESYDLDAPSMGQSAPMPARPAAAPGADANEGSTAFAPPPPAAASPAPAGRGALEMRRPDPEEELPPPRPRFPVRRMIPMRKVWDRVGHIIVPATLPGSVTAAAIAQAEEDARANELRRDAIKRLYTLQFSSGNLDRASEIAERWSAKDPLDPDALTARADVAAARGERELAIRILGSVVDVRPGDHKAQWRLARLHRWAGRAELGCRHSMAVAQIRGNDAKLLAEAARCARELGHSDVAGDLLASATDAVRRAVDALLAVPAPDPFALSGDLRLEATWDGGDDLDLAMLSPDGSRVSWLGAPTRAIISARDVSSRLHEGLALRGGAPGDYVIEITRPSMHRGIVRGTIDIVAAGERRTVPFVLEDQTTPVALVRITTKPRLVPL